VDVWCLCLVSVAHAQLVPNLWHYGVHFVVVLLVFRYANIEQRDDPTVSIVVTSTEVHVQARVEHGTTKRTAHDMQNTQPQCSFVCYVLNLIIFG